MQIKAKVESVILTKYVHYLKHPIVLFSDFNYDNKSILWYKKCTRNI